MKTCVALVICFLRAVAWAQAQAVPGQPNGDLPGATPAVQAAAASTSLSFEAKSIASGGATKTTHGSFNFSVPTGSVAGPSGETLQTHQSMVRLEVRVRNFGKTAGQAHLDCYFVATKLPRGKRYVWNTASRDIVVPASGELPEEIQSTELAQIADQRYSSSVTNLNGSDTVSYSGSRSVSGSKPYGWIVRLMSGERVLKVQASSGELESIARDPKLLEKLQLVVP